MKYLRSNEKGFTFVEILIAIAIFTIIAVAFLTIFTSSVLGIISMGNKSQASAKAQDIVDVIYAEGDLSSKATLIQTIVDTLDGIEPGNYEDYSAKIGSFDEENTNGKMIRFYVDNTEDMLIKNNVYTLTVRVYYNQFKRHVTITSPIIR